MYICVLVNVELLLIVYFDHVHNQHVITVHITYVHAYTSVGLLCTNHINCDI